MSTAFSAVFSYIEQEDEVRHKAAMEDRERQHRAEWEAAVSEKQRLAVMRSDEASFRASIMDRRTAEFEALAVRQHIVGTAFGAATCEP